MSEITHGQRVILTLVIPLIWVLGYVIFRIGTREMSGKDNEYDRWAVWYWLVAGSVVGKWLFHVLPNATLHTIVGPSEYHVGGVLSFGVLLGLVIMVFYQELARVWHDNPYYTASPSVESQEDMLNTKSMTQNTDAFIDSVDDFGADYMRAQDKKTDQLKRERIAYILLCCMFYLCGIEGIFTSFWQDKTLAGTWTMIVMACISRIMDSVIVYCTMIHGMFHVVDDKEPRHCLSYFVTYSAWTVYWGLAILLSIIPIYMSMEPDHAQDIISHWVFALVNGVCAGVLIWFWAYFMFMQPRYVNKRYTKWRLVVFIVGSTLQGMIALFI